MLHIVRLAFQFSPIILGVVLIVGDNAFFNKAFAAGGKSEAAASSNLRQKSNLLNLLISDRNNFQLNSIPQAKKTLNSNRTLIAQLKTNIDESVKQVDQQPGSMSQVTSVSQLSDVQPTDWAFQALQSLVERYGCIAGYPNGTYRGNRAMTRYEFAAGLKACLERVNELIATATADLVRKEDLEKLRRLQEEFSTELASVRGRVDALEARTSEVEANQFSATTKLNAEVIFSLAGVSGGNRAVSANFPLDEENRQGRRDDNITLSNRVRLNFDSSFTGTDRLKIRLQAANTPELKDATGTNNGRLAYEEEGNNNVVATVIEYKFPLGSRTQIAIAARDELYRFIEGDVEAVSPQEDDGNGSISKFGRFSPIFRLGGERISGVSISHEFNPAARLTFAYLGGASSNDPQFGFFNDAYVALTQATLKPIKNLTLGLTYARSYSANLADENRSVMDFEVGSKAAINPFPNEGGSAARMNSYSIQAAYRFNPGFILSGWYSFYKVEQLASSGHKADVTNWAVQATLPDFGGDANMLGLTFGQPGKVTASDYSESNSRFPEPGFRGAEPNTAYHVEAFYRYALNDRIAITPGVIYVINPENNKQNDNFWVGVLRTTFTF